MVAVISGILFVCVAVLTSVSSIQPLALTWSPLSLPVMYECTEHVPMSSLRPLDGVFIFNRHK